MHDRTCTETTRPVTLMVPWGDPAMHWNEVVEKVTPHVLKIETPQGHGTGFLCLYNYDKTFVGIATAHHVIDHAHRWLTPIRVTQYPSGKSAVIGADASRAIWTSPQNDSALILANKAALSNLVIPDNPLPLFPVDKRLAIGNEIGWLGFPALGDSANMVCFFAGTVSAWQEESKAYLVDGVSINGCSGGPVVFSSATDGVQVVGAVSAYIVNRATGESLPGLAVAQDVSYFHFAAAQVKSIDDALRTQEQQEQQKRISGPDQPTGPVQAA